jgi:hypothetical protein
MRALPIDDRRVLACKKIIYLGKGLASEEAAVG